MHLFLIAAITSYIPSLATVWVWVQVALGLGAVIFIHELGHFVVAKLCGVKCEKFYLGFDIGGWKLLHFKWGETEYGIGALPLGGYVKMLGQDDNPAAAKEEMDRAKAAGEESGSDKPVYDPRSYQAQSVPERMAIISAGVIMNVIFAYWANFGAYCLGVPELPSIVSTVAPAEPAWQVGLRTGDVITRIDNKDKNPRFDKDLIPHVVLADMTKGVELTVDRPGEEKPLELVVKPRKHEGRKKPTIGIVTFPKNTTFAAWDVKPDASAYRCEPELKTGDKIVKVGDKPISTYLDLATALTAQPADTLTLTVERPADPEAVDSPTTELKVKLPPNPQKTLGFSVALGPVVAVQDRSPGLLAGVQPGDQIELIDGQPPGDPATLDERLRQRGLKELTLSIRREGRSELVEIRVTPRAAPWIETPFGADTPFPYPMLGIACQAGNRIEALDADGPAAKAGLKVGDVLASAKFVLPEGTIKKGEVNPFEKSFTLEPDDKRKGNMPAVLSELQSLPKGSKIELVTKDGRKADLELADSRDFHGLDRGLSVNAIRRIHVAENFADALALAGMETRENVFQVYWFLQKLGTGQVDVTNLRGPGTIAKVAGDFAGAGFSYLLTFLAMLSANLAVINFLPIPVLDGGHMVFLIWEGIRGKPASEKVLVGFQYVGLALIGTLMVFVITMDVTDLVGYLSRFFG